MRCGNVPRKVRARELLGHRLDVNAGHIGGACDGRGRLQLSRGEGGIPAAPGGAASLRAGDTLHRYSLRGVHVSIFLLTGASCIITCRHVFIELVSK